MSCSCSFSNEDVNIVRDPCYKRIQNFVFVQVPRVSATFPCGVTVLPHVLQLSGMYLFLRLQGKSQGFPPPPPKKKKKNEAK